jgi:hypothetical protein
MVSALAVGLTILLGQQLRCPHLPAGGMAFLAVFLKVSWGFSRLVPAASPYLQHWL